jgi:predicted GNAT family N-acyltransferase
MHDNARPFPPRVTAARGAAALARVHAIRRAVFVNEQGVSEAEEMDARDGACHHYLARRDGTDAGTARLRPLGEGVAKIERMAVLAAHRRTGIGRALIARIEEDARRQGIATLVLHAQAHAVPFYAALGYVAVGAPFEEAGIPHRFMRKRL